MSQAPERNKTSRRPLKIDHSHQYALFDLPVSNTRKVSTPGRRTFLSPSPKSLSYGGVRLDQFLQASNLKVPLIVRSILESQDWSLFEQKYGITGRAPYAPMNVMGLILYGIMQGVSSLRGLEQMARADLGSHWVTGGLFPDHSSLGRFIFLHEEALSGGFFESLTRTILAKSGSNSRCLSGDGTVIEAACSHYHLLKEEAVKQQLHKATDAVKASPTEAGKQTKLNHAKNISEQFKLRQRARQGKGQKTDALCISRTDPDAMVQPLKRNRGSSPSYKPSVLANEQRIIVGHSIDASSETKVVGMMLDQSARIQNNEAQELLLDSGYFAHTVLSEATKRGINLLCSEKNSAGLQTGSSSPYPKSLFIYDENSDCYQCPAGEILMCVTPKPETGEQRKAARYKTKACEVCHLRPHCTRSILGRQITRYEGDDLKEALRQVMAQPQARERYTKRQGMVEPVFSYLRGKQGLMRFRRRGLAGVKREFSLHVLAYNLSRAVAFIPLKSLRELIYWLNTKMKLITPPITKLTG